MLSLSITACESTTVTESAFDPERASTGTHIDASRNATDYAIIGDVPYGAAAAASFRDLIESINRDPLVRRSVHVGDTKNGSTVCSDELFDFIYDSFQSFSDPLVYSPGDNEWTDCHRDNNGNWNPLERLATARSTSRNQARR